MTAVDRSRLWVIHFERLIYLTVEVALESDEAAAAREAEIARWFRVPAHRLPSPHRVRARVLVAPLERAVPDGTGGMVMPDDAWWVEHSSQSFPTLDAAITWAEGYKATLIEGSNWAVAE